MKPTRYTTRQQRPPVRHYREPCGPLVAVARFLARFGWYRRLTDKPVRCRECGDHIGYVWQYGHDRWLCARCAPGDTPRAVTI